MLPFELVIPKQLKSLIITDSKQYKFIFKRKHCKECYFYNSFPYKYIFLLRIDDVQQY